jgi:hypothetical protein
MMLLRIGVYLIEVVRIINEVACLLAILLHEVILRNVETLLHSFAYGDAGHNDDKLCPTVTLVQLEHCLDIDVGLTSTGLHFYIDLAGSKALYHLIAEVDVVLCLYLMNIFQY